MHRTGIYLYEVELKIQGAEKNKYYSGSNINPEFHRQKSCGTPLCPCNILIIIVTTDLYIEKGRKRGCLAFTTNKRAQLL